MSGEQNYRNVIESLRRPSADSMLADIIEANKSTIASQAESIKMLHQMIELYRQALGLPVTPDAV